MAVELSSGVPSQKTDATGLAAYYKVQIGALLKDVGGASSKETLNNASQAILEQVRHYRGLLTQLESQYPTVAASRISPQPFDAVSTQMLVERGSGGIFAKPLPGSSSSEARFWPNAPIVSAANPAKARSKNPSHHNPKGPKRRS